MYKIARNIGIIVRSERLILRHQLSVMLAKAGFLAIAGLIALIGLVMVNIAGFFALEPMYGAALSALIVGGVDFLLAIILAIIAGRKDAAADTEGAAEVRELAKRDLEHEVRSSWRDVERLRGRARVYAHDPAGVLTGKVLQRMLAMILRR